MCNSQTSDSVGRIDPVKWVEDHGEALYHYVLIRVGKSDLAEDLVQETFLAALHAREKFAGRSSERTWLVGILRNKILEHFRLAGKQQTSQQQQLTDVNSYYFDKSRHWKSIPKEWKSNPETIIDNQEFWNVFHSCMKRLSKGQASVFVLREMDELGCEEICRELGVTDSSLWVRLHRARLQLRQCLEQNWFCTEK